MPLVARTPVVLVVARGDAEHAPNGKDASLSEAGFDALSPKRLSEALQAIKSQRQLALDSAELGSWHVDPSSMTLVTDQRFRTILGATGEQLSYSDVIAMVHPEDYGRGRAAIDASIRPTDNQTYGVELRIIQPDGSVRWVFAIGRANFHHESPEQVLSSFDGTISDITERKRADEELRRLAADLSEVDRRKSEFLATLAHELRNPLAPIRNGLEIMRQAADKPAIVARAVDMMQRQLGHLVRLVDDLLDISRISSGKIELKKERVDLNSVVASAIETSRPLIDAGLHTLNVGIPEEPLPLDIDPTRFAQVLSNLLNNSAKYTAPGGLIELMARREGGEVVITVTDSGIGIARESLPKIFEIFVQLGQEGRAEGGLGIGLSLVRRLVELHGGTVTAISPGAEQGSTFTIRMPIAHGDGLNDVPPVTDFAILSAPAVTGRRVLLVDDNADAVQSLAELLQIGGHIARVANDGFEALQIVDEFRPEVIFLDIGMPGMTGYEVARALRKAPGAARPILVALTGWGTEGDRERSTDAGFDHHLVKPVNIEAVERLLTNCLNQSGAQSPDWRYAS